MSKQGFLCLCEALHFLLRLCWARALWPWGKLHRSRRRISTRATTGNRYVRFTYRRFQEGVAEGQKDRHKNHDYRATKSGKYEDPPDYDKSYVDIPGLLRCAGFLSGLCLSSGECWAGSQ